MDVCGGDSHTHLFMFWTAFEFCYLKTVTLLDRVIVVMVVFHEYDVKLLHLLDTEDGGTALLLNVSNCLPIDTLWHARRLWEPEIWHYFDTHSLLLKVEKQFWGHSNVWCRLALHGVCEVKSMWHTVFVENRKYRIAFGLENVRRGISKQHVSGSSEM